MELVGWLNTLYVAVHGLFALAFLHNMTTVTVSFVYTVG
jgi:hypothetical protein